MFNDIKHIFILHVSRQYKVYSVGHEGIVDVLEEFHILFVAL